jgi:ubiquinone/menaquinone biosynthesis C-methylase UbiE
MPGAVELVEEAEEHLCLSNTSRILSVACGTGEIELYLAAKYGCSVSGVDIGDWAVSKARKKADGRGLAHVARFDLGDGGKLTHEDASFDVVLCSGAICEFFDAGLAGFHRILKPQGLALIIEVVWRKEDVPSEVAFCWTGGRAQVFSVLENIRRFGEHGFKTLLAKEYDQPAWWEAYYDDRGTGPNWQQERMNYRKHRDFVGLGLFLLQREK